MYTETRPKTYEYDIYIKVLMTRNNKNSQLNIHIYNIVGYIYNISDYASTYIGKLLSTTSEKYTVALRLLWYVNLTNIFVREYDSKVRI